MSFFSSLSNLAKQVTENPEHLEKAHSVGNQLIDQHLGGDNNKTATAAPEADWMHQQHQNANSTKKALFIGINYFNTEAELRGCIQDVANLSGFVHHKCGFPENNMRRLTDDGKGNALPTRANILANMKWLVAGAKAGDSLFFHYSGHGSQQKDTDGDEADGMDETICPVDYDTAGMITDDDMHSIMCAPLPAGVKLTAIFDCCHSGSALDLPFMYTIDGNLQIHEQDSRVVAAKHLLRAGLDFLRGDRESAKRSWNEATQAFNAPPGSTSGPVTDKAIKDRTTAGDVVLFSGCQDTQTSADAVIDGTATGAMSYAFISAFEEHSTDITYQELLQSLRKFMLAKYSQIPQLSAGRPLNMNVKFAL